MDRVIADRSAVYAQANSGSQIVGPLDHGAIIVVLGASSWRVAEITRDQVLVEPAPGVPGKLPKSVTLYRLSAVAWWPPPTRNTTKRPGRTRMRDYSFPEVPDTAQDSIGQIVGNIL